MPTGRYTDIIGRLRPNAIEPGDIVDLDGRVIGRHQGIVHFTVGQRRGLGIAASAPLYVVRLDAASRRVVVGPREALRMDRIVLRDVNWIGDGALDRAVGDGLEMFVRVRSTRAPQPAWLRATDGGYEVELVAGEEGVSPGQACVFYDAPSGQARVLGGGFIQSATAQSGAARSRRAAAAGRGGARIRKFQGGGMAADIDRAGVAKAYERWAPVYDLVFGKVFDARPPVDHRRSRQDRRPDSRCRRRHRIVAVGLFAAPRNCAASIFPNRCCARRRAACARSGLHNVETLAVMDAKNLAFPDSFFDAVVAQYVITAVPDPEAHARRFHPRAEARRRTHPGQSHRRRERPAPHLRTGVRAVGAPARLAAGISLGAAGELGRANMAASRLTERRPMPPMGHFSLIRYRKS